MRLNKKIIILILLFLSVLLIKNKALALTLNPEDYYNYNDYLEGLTPLKLQTETNSYTVSISKTLNKIIVVEPFYSSDILVTYRPSTLLQTDYNILFKGYNKDTGVLSDVIYYTSNLSDGSWTTWETSYSSSYDLTVPGNSEYFFIDKSNIYCYGKNYYVTNGLIGNESFCDILLPDGITFKDNILIFNNEGTLYLCITNSDNNYFKFTIDSSAYKRFYLYCYSPSGSKSAFSVYKCEKSSNELVLSDNNATSLYCSFAHYSNCYYSTFDFYQNDYLMSGFNDFFDFYYEYKYFPTIYNTANNLAAGLDTVLITPGEFKKTEDFYFAILHTEEVAVEETGTTFTKEVVDYSTKLNADSPYFLNVYAGDVEEFWYEISPSVYADLLEKNKQYIFRIQYDYNNKTYYNDIYSTWGGLTSSDIEQNKKEEERYQEQLNAIYNQTEKIEEQTNTIKEQIEVSKGIWETLKEVLSYINPLSENFFAYKLINLLIDGLKSLFLPDERIF